MNRVALLIRRRSDYECGNSFRFYDDCGQEKFAIDRKIRLWNSVFTMPYFDVRRRLYDIAFGDIESLGFDLVFRQINDKIMSDVERLSGYWIVPIDDDDWISPFLPSLFRKFESNDKMCHWGIWLWPQDSISMGRPNLKTDFRSGLGLVRSCAYAVRPSLGREVMTNHGKTVGLAGSILRGVHSVYVRTPASVCVLRYHPDNEINLVGMWAGMSLLCELMVPTEFRKKVALPKALFEECRPRRSLL